MGCGVMRVNVSARYAHRSSTAMSFDSSTGEPQNVICVICVICGSIFSVLSVLSVSLW